MSLIIEVLNGVEKSSPAVLGYLVAWMSVFLLLKMCSEFAQFGLDT